MIAQQGNMCQEPRPNSLAEVIWIDAARHLGVFNYRWVVTSFQKAGKYISGTDMLTQCNSALFLGFTCALVVLRPQFDLLYRQLYMPPFCI